MLDMKKVARNIKNARTKKNMTQLELADIVGVSYQAVSNWERGSSMPDIAKISDIAKALDISVTDLLGDDNGSVAIEKVLEKSPEPLTGEELTEVASILPPMVLQEEVKKTTGDRKLNLQALIQLAPFLEDEYLEEVVKEVDVNDMDGLSELAAYMSEEALDVLVDKAIKANKVSELTKIAPYLEDESLRKIADFLIHSDDTTGLSEITQFL